MSDERPGDPPLACSPGAIDPGERGAHRELIWQLFSNRVEERQPIRHGYEFRFPSHSLREVVRFLENERKCCPFLHFNLDVPPSVAAVHLRITGPEGTREFLDAELPGHGSRSVAGSTP
jgi:hypothetical protein